MGGDKFVLLRAPPHWVTLHAVQTYPRVLMGAAWMDGDKSWHPPPLLANDMLVYLSKMGYFAGVLCRYFTGVLYAQSKPISAILFDYDKLCLPARP